MEHRNFNLLKKGFDPHKEVRLFSIKVLKSKFGGSQWSFVVENTFKTFIKL